MSETQDELNWLAFRYVAGELNVAEASKFESLLTTDQAAREAVARAVEQTTQLHQAFVEASVVSVASRQAMTSRQATRVTIVAVGSCLMLLLAFCFVGSSILVPNRVARQIIQGESSASPAQLAFAWAETRHGLTESQLPPAAELSDPLEAVLDAAVESESEQPLVAPSWMLAALASMDVRINSDQDLQD